MSRKIVINATNIGRFIDGIGTYTLNVLRELSRTNSTHRFVVYLNRTCVEHVRGIRFPNHFEIRWVSSVVSPDRGFLGHLMRLLYSNFIGVRHPRSLIVVTAQLEAVLFRRWQVITIHDVIPLLFRRSHRKQYYFFKYVLGSALRRARFIVTPSEHTKSMILATYQIEADRVRVVPHGVEDITATERCTNWHRCREPFVLFIGRLAPTKNLVGLLRAFNLIKERIPHTLVVTGRYRPKQLRDVLSTVRSSGAPLERVEFRGYVSDRELGDLMDRASVLAFPSLCEGFGLPPLEGMARGCPVLVSNVASLPEVCGDAAYYVDPMDAESIADGLVRLSTDEKLRAVLSERGRMRAASMPWKRSAEEHLKLFTQAIDERHATAYNTGFIWRLASALQTNPLFAIVLSIVIRNQHHAR
jgi:glycosyltransferase involved in cell wall biosynthesis